MMEMSSLRGFVDGAGQAGPVLVTRGWNAVPSLPATVCIHGIERVNPITHEPAPTRALFSVTGVEDVCQGTVRVYVNPPIIPSGRFKNVSASPANQAMVEVCSA